MAKPKPSAPGKKLPSFETVAYSVGLEIDQAEAARTLLEDLKHPQLGLRRYLYVTDPVPGTDRVKVLSPEALFPEAILALRNLYVALPGGVGSDLYRDGVELLCLSILLKRPGLAGGILVRGSFDLARVPVWLTKGNGPVLEIASKRRPDAAIVFRSGDPALPGLVHSALELYQTGAVLGLADYSLSRVLGLAKEISP